MPDDLKDYRAPAGAFQLFDDPEDAGLVFWAILAALMLLEWAGVL